MITKSEVICIWSQTEMNGQGLKFGHEFVSESVFMDNYDDDNNTLLKSIFAHGVVFLTWPF